MRRSAATISSAWQDPPYLAGDDAASVDAWVRAHNEHLQARQDVPRAARCTFWMVLELLSLGEWAREAGRLATAQRLLDDGNHDCPGRGLLQVLFARGFLKDQDEAAAYDAASQAVALGDRFNDPDLKAFGRLSQGLVHARRGEADAAASLFDEVMVAVTNGSVSLIGAGTVYCAVISGYHELLDVGRAREWTAALAAWCSAQPDLVAYRGQCRVHRAETMRLCGAWTDAMEEARQAVSGTSWLPAASTTSTPAGRPCAVTPPVPHSPKWEWQATEVPYEAARARVLTGLACRHVGDEEGARMELEAARAVFDRPDVARVDRLLSPRAAGAGVLTPRELEVIRLIAAGRTNRAIARALTISERTVDRHVGNILTKLGLSSRTAATAYAYEHGLV